MLYYAFTIFLSAFLLFQVQPIISKHILPWFGGSPTVWTTCMLFFQLALLLGYFYAHVVGTRLRLKWQFIVHGVLVGAALCVLPLIYASPAWKPDSPEHPTWHIILLLTATVGLPYFVLATTSPLLQKWFSLARPDAPVYRLYALSNVGSLLALITYPSLIEPTLTGTWQAGFWAGGFALFALLCACSAYLAWKGRATEALPSAQPAVAATGEAIERPGILKRVLWLLLAACASTMLLAVTNQMCLDVAVVPFLWVLPLGLYLLSFIICFDSERWYYRPVFWPLMAVSCGLMAWVISEGAYASIERQIGYLALGLFVCCMVCHGELVRLKPHPRYLTSFYLMVSAGGALGGIFVTLIAPHIFRSYTELNIGIIASFAVAATAFLRDLWRNKLEDRWVTLFSFGMPTVIVFVVLTIWLANLATVTLQGCLAADRNFYGVLRVTEEIGKKSGLQNFKLLHGRISHGWQFASKKFSRSATSYYGEKSGVGLMFLNYPPNPPVFDDAADDDETVAAEAPPRLEFPLTRSRAPIRVGVLGLGTGSIAVYGQPGDHFTFYEINSNVVKLATTWFTYLQDTPAQVDIVMGDARLSMERELKRGQGHQYDILVLDAFAGDAVPVHLLTCEAFDIYRGLLKPDGVIAVNVANRHLDLSPVIRGVAHRAHLRMASIWSNGDVDEITTNADWILVSADAAFLSQDAIWQAAKAPQKDDREFAWTDDFSDMFRVIKW